MQSSAACKAAHQSSKASSKPGEDSTREGLGRQEQPRLKHAGQDSKAKYARAGQELVMIRAVWSRADTCSMTCIFLEGFRFSSSGRPKGYAAASMM